MKILRSSVLIVFFSIVGFFAFGQEGYSLKFRIKGLKDTIVYLGNHYSESRYIKDTAKVDGKGDFVFEGKDPLAYQGVYFLSVKNTELFKMVIGANQHFSMTTSTDEYVLNMKVTGDLDNKLFFENMLFNRERNLEADPFLKIIQDSTSSEVKRNEARRSLSKINDEVVKYQQSIIQKHPNTVTARIFKVTQPVRIPDPPKSINGTIDSTFRLRWYREHFFDNFDLSDPALLCLPSPFYMEKINEYLDKLYAPHPDTITKAVHRIINKSKSNKETYRFAAYRCLLKYQQPEIMGLDEVYVNIYDKYFASGEMDFWVNTKLKKNLKDHADQLRKSLVGGKAPNLVMQDANLKRRSMYDIKNKYTILYIFNPDCHSCKLETPKLAAFYDQTKFDVQVFAVSTDTSMAKMRDYVRDMKLRWITVNGPRTYEGHYMDLYDAMETPSLYVIDDQKKIIGKKVPAAKLEEFFTQYEKFNKTNSPAAPNTSKKL